MTDPKLPEFTLEQVAAFLDGSAPLDGCWFGEKNPKERGMFWWRKHLRNAIAYARVSVYDGPPSIARAAVELAGGGRDGDAVERVARAMYEDECDGNYNPWHKAEKHSREVWIDRARAAIAAMTGGEHGRVNHMDR